MNNNDMKKTSSKKNRRITNLSDGKILIIVFSSVAIFIIILLWISIRQGYMWECEYTITIKTGNAENFTIIIPVAMKNENEISKAMNSIQLIEGQAHFNLTNTQYGKGLRIDGQKNVTVGFKKIERGDGEVPNVSKEYQITNISLWKSFDNNSHHGPLSGKVWMYAFSKSWAKNISLSLAAYWDGGEGIAYSINSSKIITYSGWQVANCTLRLIFFV